MVYDGHPIYGPFGYSTKSGGTIVQLKSGYSLDIKPNSIPLSIFPEEFFIEDFSWANSTDELFLIKTMEDSVLHQNIQTELMRISPPLI